MRIGSAVRITSMVDDDGNQLFGVVEYVGANSSVVRYCYANLTVLHNDIEKTCRNIPNKYLMVIKE